MISENHRSYNQSGSKNAGWKGGVTRNTNGYTLTAISDDSPFIPMRQGKRNYVLTHRLVMAQHLGRCLYPWENVHHINGIRDDNRLENLELWYVPQAKGQRLGDLLAHYLPDEDIPIGMVMP